MSKWLFVVLLVVNLLVFAVIQLGSELTVTPAAAPQAMLNADQIKLVSAPVAAVPHAVSSVVIASAVAPALPPVAHSPAKEPEVCMEWGEFSGTDLARSEKLLATLKLDDRLGQRTVEYSTGYWVYIPPQKNRKEAHKKLEQLKELEVSDYFVVQEHGPWLNAISLGIFKTEEAAQRYLAKLKEQGVRSAKVGERKSKLKFIVFTLKHLDAATGAKISQFQKDFPDSFLKPADCN